jgi:hypothetical protein
MQNDSIIVPPALGHDNIRRHARLMFSVPLKIHHLTPRGVRTMRGISLDISKGGIGALVHTKLVVDETVEIDMRLVGSPSIAVAVVRHSSRVVCGFEFLGLNNHEMSHIDRLGETQRSGFLGKMKSAPYPDAASEQVWRDFLSLISGNPAPDRAKSLPLLLEAQRRQNSFLPLPRPPKP